MNILFLALDNNIKGRAGDAVHIRELAGALAKLGHNIYLIAAETEDSPEELQFLEDQGNVRMFFIKGKRHFKNLSTISFCKKIARENPVNIIYERRFSAKIGHSLSKILKIPYLVEINGLTEIESKMQGKIRKQNILVKRVKKRFRRRFFMHSGKVVAVTEGIKEALISEYKLPSEKIVVIHNGANVDLFREIDMIKCKRQLGLNINNRYVCFSGNLAPWQGLETLIKATPTLIEQIPEARILILGDGMMRGKLEGMVKELNMESRFIFTGWVPYNDVPTYINSSEVCVAPFVKQRICSPIKIYEYLSCGKPVIASFIRNLDFLKDTKSGILVKPDDPEDLGNALIEVMMNKNKSKEMGTRGRQYVINEHSWLSVAHKIAEACEGVIRSNKKG